MYQVNLLNQAKKDLKKLDPRFQQKVILSLRLLKSKPFLGEKMAGEFKGSYRIKIPPIRIVYTPDLHKKIIWIRAIAHRQGVYH
ncbi:type II toxin-antitoxin system RelE/ParE family toxin [Patescibacteria group bacterium]|nr:type II toxin-antitoxin system RelE/ParE family toxin [Patescibacteria group bacterium]